MENNTQSNMVIEPTKKKNGVMIVIVIIIILAIVALIYVKKVNNVPTQSEVDLNQAVELDSTTAIKESLGNIDLTDTTDEDLKAVDQELQNL